MTSCLRVVLLLVLVAGTLGEDGFNLLDAFDDDEPTTAKPKEPTKAPEKPQSGGGLDLLDAFGGDESATEKPKKPSSGDTGGFGFDLGDALGPDTDPKPDKPAVKPPTSGEGGGSFSDSDLFDIGGGGEYKPDGGSSDGGHGPANDPHSDADQPQEAGSGTVAGIVSTIGVALAGVVGSYFAYQKKKLCFKLQGGVDPESGKGAQGTNSEPQVLSNLLKTN